MKIKELISLLNGYDPELQIEINLVYQNDQVDKCELRDLLDRDTHQYRETILQIVGDYRDQPMIGYSILTEDLRNKKKQEILNHLNGKTGQVFTSKYGDWRFYTPYGWNDNASCYGTPYDPRLFKELVAEGKITKESWGIYGGVDFRLVKTNPSSD